MSDPASIAKVFLALLLVAALAAAISAGLIRLLLPWLKTHVLAHPNARSSHKDATPQGGGAAVIAATFMVAWGAVAVVPSAFIGGVLAGGVLVQLLALTAAAALLGAVGAVDDKGTQGLGDDELPNFSSRGPTAADGLTKPDVAAPGAHLADPGHGRAGGGAGADPGLAGPLRRRRGRQRAGWR